MKHKIDEEIAAIRLLFPFKYSEEKYNTPRKQFKIIQEALYNLGVHSHITSMQQPYKPTDIVRKYKYQVELNFEAVKQYSSSHAAKMRILREYKKHKKKADEKEAI